MATINATLVTPGFSTAYDLEQAALAAVGSIGEGFADAFSGAASVVVDPTYTVVTFSFSGGGSGSLTGSFPPVEPATWTINNMSLTAPNVFFGFNGSLSFNNSTGELVGAATFNSLDVITPSLSLSIAGSLTEDLSGNISGSIQHIEVDAGALHIDVSGAFTLAPGGAVTGTITHLTASDGTGNTIIASDAQIDVAAFDAALATNPISALSGVLGSSDVVTLDATFGVSFNAFAGNDTVTGGTAADTLVGGAGDDSIRGALGADQLRGNDGSDTIRGGADADDIRGG